MTSPPMQLVAVTKVGRYLTRAIGTASTSILVALLAITVIAVLPSATATTRAQTTSSTVLPAGTATAAVSPTPGGTSVPNPTITAPVVPTSDPTVQALEKEKLRWEIEQLKANTTSPMFRFFSTFGTPLAAIIVGGFGVWQFLRGQRAEREKREGDARAERERRDEDARAERERREEDARAERERRDEDARAERERRDEDARAERERREEDRREARIVRAQERFLRVVDGLGSSNTAIRTGSVKWVV